MRNFLQHVIKKLQRSEDILSSFGQGGNMGNFLFIAILHPVLLFIITQQEFSKLEVLSAVLEIELDFRTFHKLFRQLFAMQKKRRNNGLDCELYLKASD